MNPRFKRLAHLGSPVVIRSPASESGHHHGGGEPQSPLSGLVRSVRDEAALLLSISEICDREVKKDGLSALWDEDSLPKFPRLSSSHPNRDGRHPRRASPDEELCSSFLKPRSEAYMPGRVSIMMVDKDEDPKPSNMRARAVSIDSPRSTLFYSGRTTSPIAQLPSTNTKQPALVSPLVGSSTPTTVGPSSRRLALRKQSLRLSKQAKREHRRKYQPDHLYYLPEEGATLLDAEEENMHETSRPRSVVVTTTSGTTPYSASSNKKGKTLQGAVPKGIPIKMIMRKKFSWKNYPELEQFLIANREEYLRHSALNYTVQQKQYNNRLTEELLELATAHGYLFDTEEFSFVTVRDRIRCYFKSYVQSAKKRGVLMGYAARKAGLLTEDDIERSAGQAGRIITPS